MLLLHSDLIGWFILLTGYVLSAVALILIAVALIAKSMAHKNTNAPFRVRWNYPVLIGGMVMLGFGVFAIILGIDECHLSSDIRHRLDHAFWIYGGLAVIITTFVIMRKYKKSKRS